MDITARLQQLEELITEAKSMPLSTSVLVNREEVLELVQELRASLPEEIKQARWVVKDREQLLTKARRDAEGIIQEALEEQRRYVSQEEVVRASVREAERLLEEARQQARQLRLEAEDYIDQKLAAFEILLDKTMKTVGKGREQLRGDRATGAVPQDMSGAAGPPAAAPFDADQFSNQPL